MAKVTVNKFDIIVLDAVYNGKRHRLSTGKKATNKLLNQYKKYFEDEFQKLYNQNFSSSSNTGLISFKDYGKKVLEITKNNRNEFSQKEETQRFNRLCETFGDMNIEDIRVSHIVQWQNDCGLAPKTVKNYRSIFNQIMEMAHYDELIKKNPLKFVKTPKKIFKQVLVFNQDEMKILIDNSTGQFKNVLMFNFFAGLRGSELIALRWSNIDFTLNTVTIDTRIREGVEDVTKSKRVRVIDMLPQARKALINQRLLTGIKNDYVFLTQYGKPYKTSNVLTVLLKELCVYSKIKIGTMHTIRKSCNTLLKQYGLPNDWILDQLGHLEDGVNREHYTGKIIPDLSKIGKVLS